MPTTKISDALFSLRPADLSICPGQRSNSNAPSSTLRSPKCPSTSRSRMARYSRLAVELKKFLTSGKIAVLWSKDGTKVYGEVVTSTGAVEPYLYNAANHTLYTNYNDSEMSVIALFTYGLHPSVTKFEYTRAAAEQMVSTMDKVSGIVTPTDLGFLCDCFYYDIIDELSMRDCSVELNPIGTNEFDAVQQAIRTNSMEITDTCFRDTLLETFRNVVFTAPTTAAATGPTASFNEFFEKAKDGEYVISYDWDKDQDERIRPLSSLDDYIPNDSWRKMVALVHRRLNRVIDRECLGKHGLDAIRGDYINIIIGGRPGTGKTTTADALSAALGLPIYTSKVTKNTEEDTFEGMTKANSDGKFVLHDTAFSKAYEHGGIVVIEEFNLADPGVLQGAIGQAIEYPFILNRDGYQEVRRHPMCVIIATMNTGTQGAREPNQALTSRFPVTLTMDDPSESEFLAILEKHGHKKQLCKKVYRAYISILRYLKDTANNEEMMLCITMRHCLGALDLIDDGVVGTVREAIFDTMIGSIGLRDAELAQDVYNSAVKPLPLD